MKNQTSDREQETHLTGPRLRYLLAIYELSEDGAGVSSAGIARLLGVKKPSVSAMLASLMKKNLLVKKRYGKVCLTAAGTVAAERFGQNVKALTARLRELEPDLLPEELFAAACALTAALPGRDFFRSGK